MWFAVVTVWMCTRKLLLNDSDLRLHITVVSVCVLWHRCPGYSYLGKNSETGKYLLYPGSTFCKYVCSFLEYFWFWCHFVLMVWKWINVSHFQWFFKSCVRLYFKSKQLTLQSRIGIVIPDYSEYNLACSNI